MSGAVSEEDRLLLARISDAVGLAGKRPYFFGFLDPHAKMLAERELTHLGFQNYLFWGGFDGAERVCAGLFPDYIEPDAKLFPIGAVGFRWRTGALSHRDFLGSLLAQGIERRAVGDIVIDGTSCTAILEQSIVPFILQNLKKVGGTGVSCEETDAGGLTRHEEFREIKDTIASPRLDCVVAALLNFSRGDAAKLIEAGLVTLNYEACQKIAQPVPEGARITARGHGRYQIERLGPPTKKGRLSFQAKKYL